MKVHVKTSKGSTLSPSLCTTHVSFKNLVPLKTILIQTHQLSKCYIQQTCLVIRNTKGFFLELKGSFIQLQIELIFGNYCYIFHLIVGASAAELWTH